MPPAVVFLVLWCLGGGALSPRSHLPPVSLGRASFASTLPRFHTIITPVFHDPPVTKQQLGTLCLAAGAALTLAALVADLVGAGRFGGLGPAQRQALAGGAVLIVFGLSLLPLGQRPA